jgi:hypothetical protein
MNNLKEANPQTFIDVVMSDSSDKEETTHPSTSRSTQG